MSINNVEIPDVPEKENYANYKYKLSPFKLQVLQNFPYIEADFDAITNYQLLCKVVDYLNQVIDNMNTTESIVQTQIENIDALYNAYVELHDYVDTYFKNLDVQDEINNKLDEMAEDGSLTTLIGNYVDPIQDAFEEEINGQMTTFQNTINTQISNINNKVTSAVDINPLIASSVAGMTETDRIYVNTTDGKWYYYNGTTWEIGGTYQGTELSANAVSYNNITDILKGVNLIEELNPSDLIWIQGFNRYMGNLITGADQTTSQCFKVAKGSSITLNDTSLQVRYSFYNIDGTYITNTGNFRNIPSYNITADCYCSISYNGVYDENTINLFTIKALKNNVCKLSFHSYSGYTARFESDTIYLQKGDIVRSVDFNKIQNNGTYSGPLFYIGINKYGLDKESHNYVNYGQNSNYQSTDIVIEEDGYYKLYIRIAGDKSLTEDKYNDLANTVEIIKNDNLQNNFIDNSYYRVYISNNGKVEIIEYTGGFILFRLLKENDEIIVKKGTSTINYISFTNLLAMFPNNQEVYNGHTYLKLGEYRALYLDAFSNEFKINNLNSTKIGSENVVLLANGFGNVLNSELLIIYLKNMQGAENIFNSADYITTTPWVTKSREFSTLLNTTSKNIETYTFFTDPHLMGFGSDDYSTNLQKYVGTLQKVYNSTPMNFIVGGGDWLNYGDTPANACFKLGYIDGFMNSMFHDYHALVGNHDTNYQGTEILSQTAIDNLWYREGKKAYYKFNGKNSINYCLDTGIDSDNTMTTYRWEQVNWLASELLNDNPTHSTVYMHIVWNNDVVQNMADNVTKLINAFNNHTSITLNNTLYDFTNTTGHIDYVMCGHIHDDKSGTINNVLCIATTTFGYNQNQPTFDMIINDYDNHLVKLIRYGNGDNREFTI